MYHVQALAVARDGTSVGIVLREAAVFLMAVFRLASCLYRSGTDGQGACKHEPRRELEHRWLHVWEPVPLCILPADILFVLDIEMRLFYTNEGRYTQSPQQLRLLDMTGGRECNLGRRPSPRRFCYDASAPNCRIRIFREAGVALTWNPEGTQLTSTSSTSTGLLGETQGNQALDRRYGPSHHSLNVSLLNHRNIMICADGLMRRVLDGTPVVIAFIKYDTYIVSTTSSSLNQWALDFEARITSPAARNHKLMAI